MVSIPLVRLAGSHREVGRQLGAATAAEVRRAVAFDAELPAGRTRDDQLALARGYRAATLAATSWLVEEIEGAAEGAGVDPLALFAASIEEIWAVRPSQPGASGGAAPGAPRPIPGRCSDIVAGPPLTADGHLLVAHTNDLAPESEPTIVAAEWRVSGEPVVFSLGSGPWISVGWNDAGLSLTGNELTPNDERIGVPRLLMVREQLTARTLDEAAAMALRPDRASSYNTLLAHRDGGVLNIEGSATDAVVRRPGPVGGLAHTNHYVEPEMLCYEGDPEYARRSAVRYGRACALLSAAAPGSVTPALLRAWLADHVGAPDSICRHPAPDTGGSTSKTVFWVIADVTTGEIGYGLGNPCSGEPAERWSFAPAS